MLSSSMVKCASFLLRRKCIDAASVSAWRLTYHKGNSARYFNVSECACVLVSLCVCFRVFCVCVFARVFMPCPHLTRTHLIIFFDITFARCPSSVCFVCVSLRVCSCAPPIIFFGHSFVCVSLRVCSCLVPTSHPSSCPSSVCFVCVSLRVCSCAPLSLAWVLTNDKECQ